MYCKKCGNEIKDGAVFCTNCGWKLDSQKPKASTHKKTGIKTDKKNPKLSKKIIIIVVLVIGILGLIVGVKKISTINSAGKVAVASTKYLMEGKISKYYKLLAPPYKEYVCGPGGWYTDEDEFKKDIEDLKNEKREKIASDCGEPMKLKYRADYTIDCDAEQVNAVRRELVRDYSYDPNDIQDVRVVVVTINATGPNGQTSWKKQTGCVKIHGKWYVHRPGFESIN